MKGTPTARGIRALRILRGLSQRELAHRMSVSSTVLHRVENGYRSIDEDYLQRLAVALKMNPSELSKALRVAELSADPMDIDTAAEGSRDG